MIILSKEQVLKLHANLIKATGGSNGIRDEGMLDLALIIRFSHLAEKSFIQAFKQRRHGFVSDW